MNAVYNHNLTQLNECYSSGLRGAVLEGGSRSGKTWSSIDFIVWLCSVNSGITINIVKETYNSFKTTLYDDFRIRLGQYPHLARYNVFENVKDVQSFRLFDSRINFMGADQPSKYHGAGCDFFYINEALPVNQAIFDQLEMRCRRFWWMDFNPSVTEHWIFNVLGKRSDVKFVHTTMLDNPHIGQWEKKKIHGYEPTPDNIAAGTADDFMWKVYGLGLRASPQGLVFSNVTWIDNFPDDIERIAYGMDFGYTNSPTAIVKVGKNGNNLFVQKKFYHPVDNASDLAKAIESIDIGTSHLWADSADPAMISDLVLKGVRCFAAKKFPGSIKYGIDLIKQHKVHLVRDPDLRREFDNYKWRELNGVSLNEPVDDFNHAIDAFRYVCLMEYRR